jgi:hypothetical protein
MKIVDLVKGRSKENGGYIPGYAIVRIKSKHIVDETNGASLLPFIECKLPYDQLIDHYRPEDTVSAAALDALAEGVLVVGKKINQQGLVLEDPHKSKDEYASGIGRLTIISLRPKLIETAEAASRNDTDETTSSSTSLVLPSPSSQLYVGAILHGYVVQVHQKHGAFIRFLDGMTGLIPKVKRGLDLPLFDTIMARLVALDVTSRPIKILLHHVTSSDSDLVNKLEPQLKVGDKIRSAIVTELNFNRAKLKITDESFADAKAIRARIHCTMALPKCKLPLTKALKKQPLKEISKYHPFHQWTVGMNLKDLEVVAVDNRDGATYVELSNRLSEGSPSQNLFFRSKSELSPGQEVTGIVTSVPKNNSGLWLQLSPGISGFVPALELSQDVSTLNQLQSHFPTGAHMDVIVTEKTKMLSKSKSKKQKTEDDVMVRLSSLLRSNSEGYKKAIDDRIVVPKPIRGDLVVGRIKFSISCHRPPALMLELRRGVIGRCCITELDEVDDWINMPLGRMKVTSDDQSKEPDEEDDGMEADEIDADETRYVEDGKLLL